MIDMQNVKVTVMAGTEQEAVCVPAKDEAWTLDISGVGAMSGKASLLDQLADRILKLAHPAAALRRGVLGVHRTRTGAWRVGAKRFRTARLAETHLRVMYPRANLTKRLDP